MEFLGGFCKMGFMAASCWWGAFFLPIEGVAGDKSFAGWVPRLPYIAEFGTPVLVKDIRVVDAPIHHESGLFSFSSPNMPWVYRALYRFGLHTVQIGTCDYIPGLDWLRENGVIVIIGGHGEQMRASANRYPRLNILGGGFSVVLDGDRQKVWEDNILASQISWFIGENVTSNFKLDGINPYIRAQLAFGRFLGVIERGIGSIGCALRLSCGSPRSFQGSPNKENTSACDYQFTKANPEHVSGPVRGILLGLQVVAGALIFIGGWLFLIRGFERAGNAMDVVLDGNRNGWWAVCFWFGLALSGAGLASGVVTYALSVCSDC